MATIRELGQGAQKLSHPFKMADGNAAAGVAAVDARIEQGRQIIDMNDAAVTLVLGEAAAGQVRMVNSLLYVDPNSTGANEDLTMPAAADWRGPVSIVNTGGETIVVKNAAGIVAGTITPRAMGIVTSDGTNIYMVFAPRGEGGLQRSAGTITSAQVLALNGTPQTIVAAPGAGFVLELISVHLWLDYNSTQYVIDPGEDLAVKYTNALGIQLATIASSGFLTAANDEHRFVRPTTTAAYEPVANAPLVLHMLVGEVATGNSDLKYEVFYRIRPLEFSV